MALLLIKSPRTRWFVFLVADKSLALCAALTDMFGDIAFAKGPKESRMVAQLEDRAVRRTRSRYIMAISRCDRERIVRAGGVVGWSREGKQTKYVT